MKRLVMQEGRKCSENEKGWEVFNSDQKRFNKKLNKNWQKPTIKVDKGQQDM